MEQHGKLAALVGRSAASSEMPSSPVNTLPDVYASIDISASSQSAAPRKATVRRSKDNASQKRRCISTACIACRRRKSKCDGALPCCAACASVYGTECIYNPSSDHRRKGVYREKVDSTRTQVSTLQVIVDAILNATDDEVADVVHKIRTCDNLDSVAQGFLMQQNSSIQDDGQSLPDERLSISEMPLEGERDLAGKMGELRLENGCLRYIGGTSHLLFLKDPNENPNPDALSEPVLPGVFPITTWTRVTSDTHLIIHLLNMYFNYHYPFFTVLVRKLFWRDFVKGRAGQDSGVSYCSSLLVNAMLALGCHFTEVSGAYGIAGDSKTKGDHFFAEAKRLMVANDDYERPCLATVQAFALMSVREAGCAREIRGWVYSGMSFRMALDLGLNLEVEGRDMENMTEEEIDARQITFWGCFLFDKCWSNYLGRLPQLPRNCFNVSKFEVFPEEDAAPWAPMTDKGLDETLAQPSRTRAVALQISRLCEITGDLLLFFYHPSYIKKASSKSLEVKKLSELHQRLEEWRRDLPKEFEPKEGQLPNVILMHCFFHLQYIHLFRPFLKYPPSASPLPGHISPRRICTANAGAISKLMRLYKKSWSLRQICNIAVYFLHSACTIHLLNLPDKIAKRDISHGLKHLEEIAEDWLCARRTLSILSVLARKWNCELPEEASLILERTDEIYGSYSTSEVPSPELSIPAASASPAGLSEDGRRVFEAAAGQRGRVDGSQSPAVAAAAAQAQAQAQAYIRKGESVNLGLQVVPGNNVDQVRRGGAVECGPMVFNQNLVGMGGWSQPLPVSTGLTSMSNNAMAMKAMMENSILGPGSESHMAANSTSPSSSLGQSGGGGGGGSSMRNVSPGQGVNVDSREWILSDSQRLHQNFGSWQEGGAGSLYMQGFDGKDASSASSTVARPTATGATHSGGDGMGDLRHSGYQHDGNTEEDLMARLADFQQYLDHIQSLTSVMD